MQNDKEYNRSFLGTGWSFPPEFSKERMAVTMVSDEEDIRQSLEILLTTRLGERVMRPDYGGDLTDMVFEPLNVTTQTYIRTLVENAVLYHEPRIIVNDVSMAMDSGNEGVVLIIIDFTVSSTNTRRNYVYPFYLNEGNDIKK